MRRELHECAAAFICTSNRHVQVAAVPLSKGSFPSWKILFDVPLLHSGKRRSRSSRRPASVQAQMLAPEAGKHACDGGMRLFLSGFCCERARFLVELLSLVPADERRLRQKGVAQVCRPSLITCALPAGYSSAALPSLPTTQLCIAAPAARKETFA